MTTYAVEIRTTDIGFVEIEAESKLEAVKIAEKMVSSGDVMYGDSETDYIAHVM